MYQQQILVGGLGMGGSRAQSSQVDRQTDRQTDLMNDDDDGTTTMGQRCFKDSIVHTPRLLQGALFLSCVGVVLLVLDGFPLPWPLAL